MKKTIILLFALIVCFTFDACGNNKSGKTIENEVPASQTEPQASSSQDGNDYESDPSLPGVVRVDLEDVQYCINAPSKQIYNKGYSFVNMENYFIVYDQYENTTSEFIYEVDKSKIIYPSDVIDGMKKQFISACSYGLINASSYEFHADYENVKINGWDMAKFIGAIELKYETDTPQVDYTSAKFVGYSLIKDDCPVYFVVVDIPSKGGEDDIEQIADKIAKTFREYSED